MDEVIVILVAAILSLVGLVFLIVQVKNGDIEPGEAALLMLLLMLFSVLFGFLWVVLVPTVAIITILYLVFKFAQKMSK